jgi:hypothetical protein
MDCDAFAFAYITLRKITNIAWLLVCLIKASILNCTFVIPLKIEMLLTDFQNTNNYFSHEEKKTIMEKYRGERKSMLLMICVANIISENKKRITIMRSETHHMNNVTFSV